MSIVRWTLVSATGFLVFITSLAAGTNQPDLLFQSDEILDVRVTAPLNTLLEERPIEDELAGKFQYIDAAGTQVDLDIKIRTRGRYRRKAEVCKFPPLRLNFRKSEVKGTLFKKQDKLKLVTHCRTSSRYTQAVLREWLTYRILNIMTDASYKVRLLKITYVDSEEEQREEVRYGFIIEHRERLEKRLDRKALEISRTPLHTLDPAHTNMISMFHYMIGNTDFSQIQGTAGEPCCHNQVLFGADDSKIFSIPYDFDQAGIVGAPHASPNPKFKLRDSQERLYRGRCVNNGHLPATIKLFNENREAIVTMIQEDPLISKSTRRTMTSYLNGFYKKTASEKNINRSLIKKCI
jgi:hypothetical protein